MLERARMRRGAPGAGNARAAAAFGSGGRSEAQSGQVCQSMIAVGTAVNRISMSHHTIFCRDFHYDNARISRNSAQKSAHCIGYGETRAQQEIAHEGQVCYCFMLFMNPTC